MTTPRIGVLGPVSVADEAGVLVPVTGALARTFIAALVLARGMSLSSEALIDALWQDEPPRGARAALQTLVSRLRRATGSIVASTDAGYRLDVAATAVDLGAVSATADATEPAGLERVDRIRAALDLWRGDPGADVEADVGDELAERAAAVRGRLRRALAEALVACDDAAAAVPVWEAEAAAHPFDEQVVLGRMRSLVAAGRTADALAVFAAHRERLADELGADPSGDLVRYNAELLRGAPAGAGTPRRVGLRAAPTALIGRDADLVALGALLTEHRLVTVLGAGGLGKTRLAQAVAAAAAPDTAVVFLELAPLANADDVLPALAATLGIAEVRAGRTLRQAVAHDLRTRVVAALAETQTLLVLDNCEHIVDGVAAFTAELLAELAELRVLTTSRSPLAIAGEVVSPLGPLPVDADGAAVRLFTERARAARPGAVLPVDAVRRICARLDGSPLAIELAAARVRGMSVDEIERRLDDRFALLRGGDRNAPERHRTLLAVIEWSWRLLDEGARDLLTRLALFPDGASVDAVEAVAAADRELDALDDLAELVEQSLVQLVEVPGEPVRYRLLETVREFGAARLAERGATDEVRRAMLRWGTAFAAEHDLFLTRGEGQIEVFAEVRREADNLIALLRWGLRDEDHAAVAQLFAALAAYWSLRGAHGEVMAIAPEVVAVLRTRTPAPGDRAALFVGLVIAGASMAFFDRRTAAWAISTLRRNAKQGSSGDPLLDAQTRLLLLLGRPSAAAELLAEFRTDPNPRIACLALTLSAPLAENSGELEQALAYARAAERIAATIDDAWTVGTSVMSMAQLLGQTGHHAEAIAASESARARLERFGADDDLYELGSTIALASAATGDVARARALAAEIAGRRQAFRGFDGDRAQMAVLAIAIEAEAHRAEGDPVAAEAAYARAWDVARGFKRDAQQWLLMVGAARIAVGIEVLGGPAGAAPSLQAVRDHAPDATRALWRDVSRRLRVAALVMFRVGFWLDMPVLGIATAGVALRAAVDGLDPALVTRAWGVALRLGARQDFAVLEHDRIRAVLAQHVDAEALADAETASAGWDRAEAVRAARELLEDRALYVR